MKTHLLAILLIIVLCTSCTEESPKNTFDTPITNKYAKGFQIFQQTENNSISYIIKIKDRYDNSETVSKIYYLSRNLNNNKSCIKIPIKKAICLSTTHCAFISVLNEENTIKAVSGKDFIFNDRINEFIKSGKIVDVGYDQQIDYEKIISINPDVVFAFGVDNSSMSAFKKLIDINIPVIFVGDFLEEMPLGRTEWIKFFGCFYDNLAFATNYFDSVSNNYNNLIRNEITNQQEKPKVLVGLPWKGIWWLPGGKSFFANFIKDAGGEYFLSNNTQSESVSHSLEEVFVIAKDIDIWLNTNSIKSKDEITKIDSRLKKFIPTKNAIIYNNNNRLTENGANDFWESGIVHPDIILEDLQKIFHSNSPNKEPLYYYKKVE